MKRITGKLVIVKRILSDIPSSLYLRACGPLGEERSEGHPRTPGKGRCPLHSLDEGMSGSLFGVLRFAQDDRGWVRLTGAESKWASEVYLLSPRSFASLRMTGAESG